MIRRDLNVCYVVCVRGGCENSVVSFVNRLVEKFKMMDSVVCISALTQTEGELCPGYVYACTDGSDSAFRFVKGLKSKCSSITGILNDSVALEEILPIKVSNCGNVA